MVQLLLTSTKPILRVTFFRTGMGNEPVRDWIKGLDKDDRLRIGEDVKLVQFRRPLGMPLVRKLEADLWEVRSRLTGEQIARVLFTVRSGEMVLLHGLSRNPRRHRLMNWI